MIACAICWHRHLQQLSQRLRPLVPDTEIRFQKLRTVLPELAQVNAVLQRLVKNEEGEILAYVIVLQQLCRSPFEGL